MGHCLSSPKTNKYFTTDEVSQHNIENDCWLIANNKVYDVTHFINKHVGMKGIILNKGGQDVIKIPNYILRNHFMFIWIDTHDSVSCFCSAGFW